ncbi:RagB/SusD family nutrient uptake outer membrane protein [Aestuariibaculum lutulentum]|uniref:RagB/SusD family nutrient uptake outer membrane protein n=1 Tax=Aestuariibaculum lutulentum TaxID=2920935 RepID=A0ABS9RHR7_9FLAO|nr:RagB/SusD family nutrient uptake outer membrane protein [Aestuariibaculum lutulentum]MCH4551667.1 RagB/SusD family nutrient uptake outer membrane protein [Aestuariibaculum lutulentum]
MKNLSIKNLALFLAATVIVGCSTDFIEEKKNYQKVDVEIYQYEPLAINYVDYLYNLFSPSGSVNMAMWSKAAVDNSDVPGNGNSTIFVKATDEVAGEVDLNKEWADISPLNAHCLKSLGQPIRTNPQNDAWTRIRYCNLYINNIDQYSKLEEDFENQILGQIYFWRAWQYFDLVRLYGGIPIVLEEQALAAEDPSNQTPRSSAAEVIDQIVADLEKSQTLLENARPYEDADAGRITAAAAAALKGRVLLTWASPLFNRNDDQSRWQRAYDANLEAYNVCLASGKGLNPDWQNMWFDDNGMESVFGYGFNDFTNSSGGTVKNNYTEYQTRSYDQGGNNYLTNGLSPTKNIVDAFPMADGTPYDPSGNLNHFYRDRDPRFYYTFAYNGAIWPYSGNSNYRNWTYYWYPIGAGEGRPKIATNVQQNSTGIYLRKFTNGNSSNTNNFRNSGADYMDIRFAEVVLNLAESAIGINSLSEGKGYIEKIRERAGVTNADGHYGLASVSSRDEHFAAVINERKVEFAYENKRFFDLRRWMLYNDDFGTCTRLNQTPIEGSRRQGYYTYVKTDPDNYYVGIPDPLKGSSASIINRDTTTYPSGVSNYDEFVDYLYDNHFEVVVRDNGIESPETFAFKWYNEYYFFGIYQNLLNSTPYLQQTQGWGGSFIGYN